ncbi:MAG: HD domain-containing protein [Cyclobacteriaceae bacterium]|nr:HD domain-containing protein [Cyclobacteriaceae bacterium]
MEREQLVEKTSAFVKNKLEGAEAGHDWWHTYRVWKAAVKIGTEENADLLVVELGALLHDIADSKFYDGDEEIGPTIAREFLESLGVEKEIMEKVEFIIRNISFKGGFNNPVNPTLELQVVQDADRLDALGAIGIARTFNYGGFKNRPLHDPSIPPEHYKDREAYKNSQAPTINHFYEKLLLLKDKMNTKVGKGLAKQRHEFMEAYLNQFFKEWEGN